MNDSIYTCANGSVNSESDPTPGDCKLDKKPQPQGVNNWLADAARSKIYSDWAKMNMMKINEQVFEGNYSISPDGSNVKQRIYIFDNAIPISQLKNVVVLCNFSVANLAITPDFPYVGTWYNLMDNTSINVTSTTSQITIPSGEFRIYGNQPAQSLSAGKDLEENKLITLYPNPTNDTFNLSAYTKDVSVTNISGQVVKTFKGYFDEYFTFSVSNLSKGIYFVKITDSDDRQSVIKLMKE